MYRYSVDSTITYTSEDLVLFKESPFAVWMERLTLENPGHGILPDAGTTAPGNSMRRQDDVAAMLRAEGRRVVLVDWQESEPRRRKATLQAMHEGADFIVNAQLAVGPLAGSGNLLMKTSGYSELGDYLYVPCDTQGKTSLHSAFRLCFIADLLHSVQGVLPPRMLIIRGGADLLPLQTEDHIYHYRAVKQRFMEAQRNFRKHRMPDPSLSAHFGRWSDCANKLLKQRALQPDAAMEAAEDVLGFAAQDLSCSGRAVGQAAPGTAVERRRRPPPPPALGDADPVVAREFRATDAHPLDPPGFSLGKRIPVAAPAPALAPAAPRPAVPAPARSSAVDRDDDSAERFTPVPFSASLNTRDALNE